MAGNPQVAKRMETAAALMRSRGLQVEAFAGWKTAGRSSDFHPRAVTCHHTGAPFDIDRMLRDGREDLPGPLDNWTLHLDGSWWLTASGRANHAGVGVLPSSESYGIECTGPVPVGNTGVDAFPMYRSYVLGVACICEVEGWDATVVYAHKETARPDCRKPDPAFGDFCPAPYLDMDRFRASVQARIGGQPIEEDDMPTPQEIEDAMVAALNRFVAPGGIIQGQNHWTDFGRVLADRDADILTGQQATNGLLTEIRDTLKALQPPPPPPPAEPPPPAG